MNKLMKPVAWKTLSEFIQTSAENNVFLLKRQHETKWRSKPNWYWMWRLLQEVAELLLTLIGVHRGPAEWELTQIASISINWIEKREGIEVKNFEQGYSQED